jgi:GAF domain-containing protein
LPNLRDLDRKERIRLNSLLALDVLDTSPEVEFDALVNTAALICDVPISLISLVDEKRQWFKAQVGLNNVSETPREVALCATTIYGDGLFEVNDAALDLRFANNPLITDEPSIRFYAGVPLKLSDGSKVGSICVIDTQPRTLTQVQREVLVHLAKSTVHALESRRAAFQFSQKEAELRALTNAAPLGVFFADLNGECTFTNERLQVIFGFNEADALGSGWQNYIHHDDSD